MLALDALDVALLDRFCDEGSLPNLAAFRDSNARLDVRSDGSLLHGSVWPTFASGTGPGVHGVHWWTQWLAEEQRHVRNNHPAFAFDPFWAGFPEAGLRATVIDTPYVPLVRGTGMRSVIGWGLHDEVVPDSFPDGFRSEVERRAGKNPLSADTVEPQTPLDKLQMARRLRVGIKRRAALVEGLVRDGGWELLMATFGELHKAGHYLAAPQQLSPRTSNVDAMRAIIRPLDEALPGIIDAAGPDCDIFIFALHCSRPQVDYGHFGPQLLDLLAGRTPFDPDAHPDMLRRIRDAIPDRVHRAIWSRLPARLRAARQGQLALAGVDSSTAPIFTVASDSPIAWRLSLAGRERDGRLTPEEGEALIARLGALAREAATADGQPAFSPLLRPPVRWPGERSHRLPDAMLPLNPNVYATDTLTMADGTVLRSAHPEARNGVHSGEGFCFLRPARPARVLRDSVDARDFAPTVLGLLGAAAPHHLEGETFLA